jgi:hypothetical protein
MIMHSCARTLVRACFPALLAGLWLVGHPARTEAQVTLGGHIGASLPIVTTSTFGNTYLGDNFSIGIPMGITVRGTGNLAFDLELVPQIESTPRLTTLTVDPGLIWDLGNDFALGVRAGFDIGSAGLGFTPLVSHSWPTSRSLFRAYFLELRIPVRWSRPTFGPDSSSVSFDVHGGVSF